MSSTVVVYRALGLGDFLTSVPALAALRAEHPDDRLVLATSRALQPLAYASGLVDDVLPVIGLEPVELDGPPELAVNLHDRGPQSHRILLSLRPRRLIAFANPDIPESAAFPVWRRNEHEVDRWCRLLREFGIAADARRLRLPPPTVAPPAPAVGATLIHPGAGSGTHRWPAERWAEVARGESRVGNRVAISAGPSEVELARRVASLAGLPAQAVVAGPLLEMAAAVAAARVVACAHTGIAHLATAYGTPAVVVFGPTPPWLYGPPMWHPHIALWSGDNGDALGGDTESGMLSIDSEQVLIALRGMSLAA